MGSGGGGAPRRAPLDTGFRRYDDGGVWGGGGCWWGAPFECPQDRLRQAQGERCRGVSLRRGVGDAMGDGDAPRPCPGFPRSRERRWGGVGYGGGCLWWGAPFECPQDRLRQAQGERCRGVSLRRGVGDAMGDGDAPRPCPGFPRSRERRWGGVGYGGGCLWWGEGPAAAGRAVREPPLRRGVGDTTGDGDAPRRAPALGSRVRGNDDGGCGVWRGLLVVGGGLRVPSGQASTGSGRTDLGGACAVGSGGCDGGRRRPAPRPSGFLPSQE